MAEESVPLEPQFAEFEDFLTKAEASKILYELFSRRQMWEKRLNRVKPFRNGEWFTVGSNMYLDLVSEEQYPDYLDRVSYWNSMLLLKFPDFYRSLREKFEAAVNTPVIYLSFGYPPIGIPGFHIFPGFEASTYFFGKKHQDLKWKLFDRMPDFPFKQEEMTNHFSFTLPLMSPYMGSTLIYGENLEKEYEYTDRTLVIHSGQFPHAIGAFKAEVLPTDYRITLQGHGFTAGGEIYLYW